MKKSRSKFKRYSLIAVLLLLAVIGARAAFFPASPPATFAVAEVTRANLEDSVLASGTLDAIERVSVGAQATGQLKSLKVALGDRVKKGQLVAEIDDMTQQNELRNAEAALQTRRAERTAKVAVLKQAELAFRRQRQMLAADASSREAYENAEATLGVTRAEIASLDRQIAQAEIQVDTARVNLGYTRIVSPIDGMVVAVVTKEGQTVNSIQSAPTIIKVAQVDTMTVKAQISEADVTRVKPGLPVYFTILGEPDQRYRAQLRAVEPAPDSVQKDDATASLTGSSSGSSTTAAVYYNGLFDVPNPDEKLRISMTAQVFIVLGEAKDTVVVPSSALGKRGEDGRYAVRVVLKDNKTETRQVRIGMNNNVQAQVLEGLEVGERVVSRDAAPAAAAPGPEMSGPLISLKGVRREFPAGEQTIAVLKDIDLAIEAGEMVAIVGASGSGKSTLMNILGCLDRPTRGEYRVDGRSTGELDPDELAELRREHFGFIFQRYHLLSDLTAQGNVEVPAVYAGKQREARLERANELLRRLGLGERSEHRPGQLSGGQQQRVSIARALMNGGDIILADEPTGALDTHTGQEVLRILEELNAAGHTIIIVTHDMNVARHAQRIIEISDGEIVADKRNPDAPRREHVKEEAPALAARPVWQAYLDRCGEALRMALLA